MIYLASGFMLLMLAACQNQEHHLTAGAFARPRVAQEDLSRDQSLAGFIKEKYGIDPADLQRDAVGQFNFKKRVHLPELELEIVFPFVLGGHSSPCLILHDAKNAKIYHKCDVASANGHHVAKLENRVKKHLLEQSRGSEFLNLPDSIVYAAASDPVIKAVEDYLNHAFVDTLISEPLFLGLLDLCYDGLGYSRISGTPEAFLSTASRELHDHLRSERAQGLEVSQEALRHVVARMNRLWGAVVGNHSGQYTAIYQSSRAKAKVACVSLGYVKLNARADSADKHHYALYVDELLLLPHE